MDVHVPGPITNGLRRRGVDVLTAQEDGSDDWADSDLVDRAALLQRVLFTYDQDFIAIAADRQKQNVRFSGIVFANQYKVSWRRSIDDLEMIAKATDPAYWQDRLERLPI